MIREELIQATYKEMDKLIGEYYERGGDKMQYGSIPIEMDWDMFIRAEQSGAILCAQSRMVDVLNGFVFYIIHKHPQHRGHIAAQCNTLAVHPDHRNKGIGRGLMEFAEPLLRDRNVSIVIHGSRTIYDAEPLFPKLGYKLIEHSYHKELV